MRIKRMRVEGRRKMQIRKKRHEKKEKGEEEEKGDVEEKEKQMVRLIRDAKGSFIENVRKGTRKKRET